MRWHTRALGAPLILGGLLTVLLGTGFLTSSQAQESQGLGLAVVSIGTTVRDMDRAVAFYRDVLEFEVHSDVECTD